MATLTNPKTGSPIYPVTLLDNVKNASGEVLSSLVLTKTNTTVYTPSADYQPATKKYVDDAPKSRILNITLPAANWAGSGPYTQTVTIAGGTANTKVDIMFDDAVYQQMVDDQVGYLAIANENGTFTATAKGGQPSADLSIQVECKEVTPPPNLN